MKKLKFVAAAACVLVTTWAVDAAEGTADNQPPNSAASEVADTAAPSSSRAARVTDLLERGEALQQAEQVVFFELEGAQHWLVKQRAMGVERGNVLLIADAAVSANGNHHLAALRRSLPNFGWHTYFMNGRDELGIAQLVAAATGQMDSTGRLLLICESASCATLGELETAQASGAIFINAQYQTDSILSEEERKAWAGFPLPGLILQEHPQAWPQGLALHEDFELHLLPPGRAAQENSRVLRKIRGWLKRQTRRG